MTSKVVVMMRVVIVIAKGCTVASIRNGYESLAR